MMEFNIEIKLTKEQLNLLIGIIDSDAEMTLFSSFDKKDLLNPKLMRDYFIRAELHQKLSAIKNR